LVKSTQIKDVRYPGHTIQILNYGYSQHIRKVLALAEIYPEKIKWRLYDYLTPYYTRGKD
jgi:hypothetical protein